MESLSEFLQDHNIYFNFFSFANLLATVFTFLVGLFLVTLKNRSKSTTHLGMVFMWMAPFGLAYVFAHSYYGPEAAYHRWITVGIILFPLIHMAQWCFKYPENIYPILSRVFLSVQYLVSFVFTVYFILLSLEVGIKFNFAGHHFDFDADQFSSDFGKIIMLYMLLILVVTVWKIIVTKTSERWTVLAISFAMLASTLPVGYLNVASRDGYISRGTFATMFVIMTVIGYFIMVVLYINHTSDRTSFMAKIVGISLVSFLVMMQVISLLTLRSREKEYDALHVEYVQRILEGGSRHEDVEYIVRYPLGSDTVRPQYMKGDYDIAFNDHREDLANTAIYEKILKLDEIDFRYGLNNLLATETHTFFGGYTAAIQRFLGQSELEGPELRAAALDEFEKLNTLTQVHYRKIELLSAADFKVELMQYLEDNTKDDFAPFTEAIKNYVKQNPEMRGEELKVNVLRIMATFKQEDERHFRKLANEPEKIANGVFRHFTAFTHYVPEEKAVYEVGFSYRVYREYIHTTAYEQKWILLVVLLVLLVVFPLFFRGGLINPLTSLLSGVTRVNEGDLSVEVPVKVHDEIGFLADSFNSMVVSIRDAQVKLQDYANNLEEKVKDRTAELNQTLERVNALKTQQDGDYFLTSLLQKPLNYNANKSENVKTGFYLEQKKKFEFRSKKADLGGDCCVTGNLRLGSPDDFRRYVVACNGDAMGKSMQGAGGSLVMGVVMNSIMARSAKNNRVLDTTPEQWLTDVYDELHGVFMAFNGSMVISCVIAVVDEESGDMWYFNAEHPFTVLYRNGKASFIEEELQLRKLGLESEIPFKVHFFKMEPGDVIIMGSDGRDDIDMTPDEPVRTINEDEFLFLKRVEESDGDLDGLVNSINAQGVITDDLSLLKLGFKVDQRVRSSAQDDFVEDADRVVIDIDVHDEGPAIAAGDSDFDELFHKGRELAREGRHQDALDVLNRAYEINPDNPSLNRIMGVLTFKGQDYERAVEILNRYLEMDASVVDFWLYLSIAHKRTGDLDRALTAARKVAELDPNRVINLINLADIHSKLGDRDTARQYVDRALELDPGNRQAQSLMSGIS